MRGHQGIGRPGETRPVANEKAGSGPATAKTAYYRINPVEGPRVVHFSTPIDRRKGSSSGFVRAPSRPPAEYGYQDHRRRENDQCCHEKVGRFQPGVLKPAPVHAV